MSERFSDRVSATGNEAARSDWARVGAMTDSEIDAAIAADEDTFALTPADLQSNSPGFKFVDRGEQNWCWLFYGEEGELLARSGQTYRNMVDAVAAADQIRRSFAQAA
ncbi:hypothetical protein GCM10009424_12210 [Sphingomonas ursincola]